MIFYTLPYWPVHRTDVAEETWPYVYHLNGLHRKSKYFDRVWNLVRWQVDGKQLVSTSEMERLSEAGDCHPAVRAYEYAAARKGNDDKLVMEAMAAALALSAPLLYEQRVAVFAELFEETPEDLWLPGPNPNPTDTLEPTGFLYSVETVHTVNAQRELELQQLRAGHHLRLWRAEHQMLGAAKGGKRSAETRQSLRRADPQKVEAMAQSLLASGTPEREIASILALRLNVVPDYIRGLRRRYRTEHGSERN